MPRKPGLYCGLDLADLNGTLVQYRHSRVIKYTAADDGRVHWLRVESDEDNTITSIHPTYRYAIGEVLLERVIAERDALAAEVRMLRERLKNRLTINDP